MITTRLPSIGSLRHLVAATAQGFLAGEWTALDDRDLDRVAFDVFAAAQAQERPVASEPVTLAEPLDLRRLRDRRGGVTGAAPSGPLPHSRAS